MSEISKSVEVAELAPDYDENRRHFPLDELAKYAGQYVAWSLDGKYILASGATMQEVDAKLLAQSIPLSHFVVGYVPPLDMSIL